MRFIQYSRKSSEGDERQAHSISDQQSVLARLATDQQLNVVRQLEEAKSAKTPGNRPQFNQMLKLIQDGHADGILCWNLSRLSRNPVDSGHLQWMLQQGTLKCIKTPEREYWPEDNVVVMAVENAVNNQYLIDLRKNIARRQQEKALRGWFPFQPPPGYRTDPISKEIVVDPERFDMLRKAWDLLLSDSYLVPEVLEKLTEWGYRTRKGPGQLGKSLGRSRFYMLFDNPFYYGDFIYRGQQMSGKHQPMVTRAEFEQVQSIIHRKSHRQPRKHSFPFTGLLKCGGCDCMVTAERKVKHYRGTNRTVTYTYYRCVRRLPCSQPAITATDLLNQIQEQLCRITLKPEILDWAETTIRNQLEADPEWSAVKGDLAEKRIAFLEQRNARLLEIRANAEISAEEYQRVRPQYDRELGLARLVAENIRDRRQTAETSLVNVIAFVRNAAPTFSNAPEKTQRQIATMMAESRVLTLGKLSMTLHPLLREFAALEPPKRVQQQKRQRISSSASPLMCSIVDNIVTLLMKEGVSFPSIDSNLQVEESDLVASR